MGILAYYTYSEEPPIPASITDSHETVLFTCDDIIAGQRVFLGSGLMEYGSVFGHGAYLGPDFTAEYLHRAALSSIGFYGGPISGTSHAKTARDFKTNCYDSTSETLVFTE